MEEDRLAALALAVAALAKRLSDRTGIFPRFFKRFNDRSPEK
jgi:hypothetical protein